MTYKIMDGGLCAIKEIDTLREAKIEAENYIGVFVYNELETIEIVNEQTNILVAKWDPTIIWQG